MNPVKGTVNTSAPLDRESPYVRDSKYTAVFIATDNGECPMLRGNDECLLIRCNSAASVPSLPCVTMPYVGVSLETATYCSEYPHQPIRRWCKKPRRQDDKNKHGKVEVLLLEYKAEHV